MNVRHVPGMITIGHRDSGDKVGADSRFVMRIHDDRSYGLLLSTARLLKEQIPSFEHTTLCNPRFNRTYCWVVQRYAEFDPIKVRHPDAGRVVASIGFLSPHAVLTSGYGRTQSVGVPMRWDIS